MILELMWSRMFLVYVEVYGRTFIGGKYKTGGSQFWSILMRCCRRVQSKCGWRHKTNKNRSSVYSMAWTGSWIFSKRSFIATLKRGGGLKTAPWCIICWEEIVLPIQTWMRWNDRNCRMYVMKLPCMCHCESCCMIFVRQIGSNAFVKWKKAAKVPGSFL